MSLSESAIPQPKSFILRITREEWLRRVFMIKKYYPGVPRRWEKGSVVFLLENLRWALLNWLWSYRGVCGEG